MINLKTIATYILAAVGSLLLWFIPSPMFQKGKYVHDNPVEEKLEETIKEATGMDIDLTPSSPEKKARSKP